jgi:hypothetical protein
MQRPCVLRVLLQWLFIIEGVPSVMLGLAMMVSSSNSSSSIGSGGCSSDGSGSRAMAGPQQQQHLSHIH